MPVRTVIRTCVGCGRRDAKASLVRLVAGPDGSVRADRHGSAPGRGAYVHPDPTCVEAAEQRGAAQRALRTVGATVGAARLRDIVDQGDA